MFLPPGLALDCERLPEEWFSPVVISHRLVEGREIAHAHRAVWMTLAERPSLHVQGLSKERFSLPEAPPFAKESQAGQDGRAVRMVLSNGPATDLQRRLQTALCLLVFP